VTPREYLAGLEFHGIKLGLENIRFLLAAAGRPESRRLHVHVAGTNGKGSVAAFLSAALGAAGYRTGRYTSPHLVDVSERFLIDGQPIGAEELDAHIAFFRDVAQGLRHPPTYFELLTAVAFRWFDVREVDVAVIEVGMGGRFDSTNVIAPIETVITTIDLDHLQYLGDTLEKIAFEKAGIIKPGVPLVVGERKPGPRSVILSRAGECRAPVKAIGRDFDCRVTGPPFAQSFCYESAGLRIEAIPLGLAGRFQGENAAVAAAALEGLRAGFPRITQGAIAEGLRTAKWPCRLERVLDDPPVIIDVAHNAAGAQRLAQEFARAVVVLAVAADKDAGAMIDALAPIAAPLILTQFEGARAMAIERLRAVAGSHPHRHAEDLAAAIRLGLDCAGPETPLLITGSVFTAGQARQWLVRTGQARGIAFR